MSFPGSGVLSGGNVIARAAPSGWFLAAVAAFTDAAAQFTAACLSYFTGADWDPTTKDFALSFWVYLDTSTATQTVISTGATTDNQDGFLVQVDSSGNVLFALNDSVQATRVTGTFTVGIADTTWTHILLYVDRSGNATCYKDGVVNGVTVNVSAHTATLGQTGGNVGADLAPANHLNARLDSMLMFELADLSGVVAAMVTTLYNGGDGTLCSDLTAAQIAAWGAVHGYEFSEATGTRADCIGSLTLSEASENIIDLTTRNGGFEDWSSATNADIWAETIAGGSTINRDGVEVDSGTFSLRMDIDGANANAFIIQSGILIPETEYAWTLRAKADAGTPTVAIGNGGSAPSQAITNAWATYAGTTTSTGSTSFFIGRSSAAGRTLSFDGVVVAANEIVSAPGIARAVCADTDGVSYWGSRLGTATATIESLAKRPEWSSAEPAVIADGVDDYMDVSTLGGASDWTIFIVFDPDAAVGTDETLIGQSTLYLQHLTDSAGKVGLWNNGAYISVANATDALQLLTYSLNSTGTNGRLYRNGSLLGVAFAYVQSALSAANLFADGAGAADFFAGELREIVVVPSVLGDAHRSAIEAELMNRHGI